MFDLKKIEMIKIFERLEREELKKVLEKIEYRVVKIKKNKVYRSRGSEVQGLYIIIDGMLSAEMLREDGNIQKIENLKKNEIIASAFIFGDNNILPVDLIALEDTEIFQVDKTNLLKLFNLENKIMLKFLEDISNRTQFLSEKIWKSFTQKTIKEKLKEYIIENKTDDTITFKHSITELSERFSVSRPSLSRVIGEYIKDEALIKVEKNRFKINKKKFKKK